MNAIRKFFAGILLLVAGAGYGQQTEHTHNSTIQVDTMKKKSIPREEHARIGDTHITILYSAPAVRGRVIWGGLIAYGEVWVTGAHRATSFEIDRDFVINNQKIPAGKYGIFTIPGKDKWIFILNKNWDQHLADDYDASQDVIRVEVTPVKSAVYQERLNYSITELSEKEAILSVGWETLKIGLLLKLN